MPELREVNNFRYNSKFELGPEGCRFFGLTKWPKLQILELEPSKIGAMGCKYIA